MVENSLSTKYFSKEFPSNWEVEWKANLSTNYPLGFINSVRDCISKLGLGPYHETTSMGDMKNGLHFHHLLYHYYGHKEGERVIRDFVLVQPPETPILIPQIKQNVLDTGLDEKAKFILIREEKKGGLSQAFPQKKHHKYLESFSQKTGFDIHHIGTIERRRYSLYLSNKMSNRNYS